MCIYVIVIMNRGRERGLPSGRVQYNTRYKNRREMLGLDGYKLGSGVIRKRREEGRRVGGNQQKLSLQTTRGNLFLSMLATKRETTFDIQWQMAHWVKALAVETWLPGYDPRNP